MKLEHILLLAGAAYLYSKRDQAHTSSPEVKDMPGNATPTIPGKFDRPEIPMVDEIQQPGIVFEPKPTPAPIQVVPLPISPPPGYQIPEQPVFQIGPVKPGPVDISRPGVMNMVEIKMPLRGGMGQATLLRPRKINRGIGIPRREYRDPTTGKRYIAW